MNTSPNLVLLVLSVLKRKPVTNKEARMNYTEVIYDYILDLESLSLISVPATYASFQQKNYLNKLLILNDRYKSLGDEFLPDSSVESFLDKLQEMAKDYLDNKLYNEFFTLRKGYYTDLLKPDNASSTPTYGRLDTLKQAAFKNLG